MKKNDQIIIINNSINNNKKIWNKVKHEYYIGIRCFLFPKTILRKGIDYWIILLVYKIKIYDIDTKNKILTKNNIE